VWVAIDVAAEVLCDMFVYQYSVTACWEGLHSLGILASSTFFSVLQTEGPGTIFFLF